LIYSKTKASPYSSVISKTTFIDRSMQEVGSDLTLNFYAGFF
jgi:hypothetical protein